MKPFMSIVVAALLMTSLNSVYAQEAPAENPIEPRAVQEDDYLEQEVTIIRGEESDRVEYRKQGVLYAVKIIPKNGPAYYLIDRDGTGEFSNVALEREQSLKIPSWVIFQF